MALPPRDSVDHTSGRPQHWTDVDDDIRDWTAAIVDVVGRIHGVAGVYVHGSLAMGGFYRPKSDLDLLAVTDAPLAEDRRRALALEMLGLFDRRPIIGGVELSIVLRQTVESIRNPAPYEFHFSAPWADSVRRGGSGPSGTDLDLAAHCAVARARGIAVAGPAPNEVFGEVPRRAYLEAVFDDLHWIVDGGILESPFYGALNICRSALVLLGDANTPPSKDEGGRWALEHLPAQHHPVIADALECYRSAATIPVEQRRHHGHRWDEQPLLEIAAWARQALRPGR